METPPIPSQAPLPVGRRGAVGKLGLFFSITALLTMLSLVLGKPSWGSPFAALGGLAFFASTPLGFLLSLIGLFFDRNRKPAMLGLGCSLLLVALFFVVALCQ